MEHNNSKDQAHIARVLAAIPQQKPFRYIDSLSHLDDRSVVGEYTFREDEWFYQGHFPGNPITPGVILIECMAQIGLVSMAAHLTIAAGKDPHGITTFFQSAQVEFHHPVRPGEKVIVLAEKKVWKMGLIRCQVQLRLGNEVLAAEGLLQGCGVKR